MSAIRSDVEENGTQDAKVSDSGYSNSCRNSQSQRSTGSSKSRHSNSSGSSGYCGRPTALGNVRCEDSGSSESQAGGSKRKEKSDSAKVKSKSSSTTTTTSEETSPSTEQVQERVKPVQVEKPDPSQTQQSNSSQQIDPAINLRSPSNSSEALQIAALTQTLTCIKKLKHKDRTDDDTRNQSRMRIDDRSQDIINNCIKHVCTDEEEMQIVVSMQDGVVLYSSPNLIDVLGYPKDMLIGRSLIDFVHPRHRIAFANHITSIIVSSQSNLSGDNNGKHANFYCCLRQYRGLATAGYNIMDKSVSYLPCQMTVTFREFQISGQSSPIIFLVIATTLVRSAYKYPDERKTSPKFTIRHCSSALMSHVDPEVVQYLGYLPQDLVGQSVLDFYHPEDLAIIKKTYNSVIMEEKQPVRSKPFRFRCQNGGFVVLDTEWSAFVNPWSRKLEFMIGQHIVLKGPPSPDVITPVENEPLALSEELLLESKKLGEEIKLLLSNTVGCNTETAKKQASKRCKDLATFMESFMDEINKTPNTKVDTHMENDKSFSERDSVMLGEISPHHEYFDSKSSSGTPPSYNQLNYKENLQRFFESKPMTTASDGSTGNKTENSMSSSPPPNNNSEGSRGASSGEGQSYSCSSGHIIQPVIVFSTQKVPEKPTSQAQKSSKYNAPHLTEQILWKHNEDMEKQMVQKHREQRSRSSENKSKDKHKSLYDKQLEEMGSHGLKRSGSHSFEGEPFKVIKSTYESQTKSNSQVSPTPPSAPVVQPTTSPSSVNLWSPFPVDTFNNNRQNINGTPLTSPLMPIYFLPSPSVPQPEPRPDAPSSSFNQFLLPQGNNGISSSNNNSSYVTGMVYQPLLLSATPGPVLYSPLTVLPAPVFPTHPPMKPPPPQTPPTQPQNSLEPGKSASAPRVTTDEESFGTSNIYDDSSFYSSFGSFALHKTDKSDESMKSSSENEKREMTWERSGKHGGAFKNRPAKRIAPWMQGVTLTTELTLKYQLKERQLDEVLKADIEALDKFNQPSLVNDQLCQMYLDLEIEGLSKTLTLEEGITSSSSDSCTDDPQSSSSKDMKKKKRFLEYEKMSILYEENAPLPPPLVKSLTT